jgi:hypothetical protein
MRKFLAIAAMLAVLAPSVLQAKRRPTPKVEPLISEGVRYTAPNDDGWRAYVQAWDAKTNKRLWEATVFRNVRNPLMEEDVQHVYLEKMNIKDGKLFIVAEDERAFTVDLKTQTIKKVSSGRDQRRTSSLLRNICSSRFNS